MDGQVYRWDEVRRGGERRGVAVDGEVEGEV